MNAIRANRRGGYSGHGVSQTVAACVTQYIRASTEYVMNLLRETTDSSHVEGRRSVYPDMNQPRE